MANQQTYNFQHPQGEYQEHSNMYPPRLPYAAPFVPGAAGQNQRIVGIGPDQHSSVGIDGGFMPGADEGVPGAPGYVSQRPMLWAENPPMMFVPGHPPPGIDHGVPSQPYMPVNANVEQVPEAIPAGDNSAFAGPYFHHPGLGMPPYGKQMEFMHRDPGRHFPNEEGMMGYNSYASHKIPSLLRFDSDSGIMSPEVGFSAMSSSSSHFKPTHTKKNSKPRIHKLNKSEQLLKRVYMSKKKSQKTVGELSIDDVYEHFKNELKVENAPNSAPFSLHLTNNLEFQLFDLFVNNLSSIVDIFMPTEIFKKVVPALALRDETGMIMDSIFCSSSLILHRIQPDKISSSVPMKYYHQSIQSIRYHLSIPGVEDNDKGLISRCLISTIMLCVYELFFVAVDSIYVKGASSILSSILIKQKNEESLLKESQFHRSCFWVMFVSDLILSLKFGSPNMYSINHYWKPLDPEYFEDYEDLQNATPSPSDDGAILTRERKLWWFHGMLLHLSAINDFLNTVDVPTLSDIQKERSIQLWQELKKRSDEYEKKTPIKLKPTIYKPCTKKRLFPIIYMEDELSANYNIQFKLSKIMLYQSLIQRVGTDSPFGKAEFAKYPANYPYKLATDIVGILKTYDGNRSIWAVNVHTLRRVVVYLGQDKLVSKELGKLIEKILLSCHLTFKEKLI